MALNVQHPNIDKFDEVLDVIARHEENNIYRLKPEVGEGYFKAYKRANWELYIGHFNLKEDIKVQREPELTISRKYSMSFRTFTGELNVTHQAANGVKKAGEGIVLNSNESRINTIWHKNTDCRMVFLLFNARWIKELEENDLLPHVVSQKLAAQQNPMFHVELTPDTRHNLRQMLYTPSEISGDFVQAYLHAKSIVLLVQASGLVINRMNQQVRKLAVHPDDLNMLEQIKIQIIDTYQEPPTLKDLVELSGMSKSKLQRLFQSVYQTSVYQFIKSIRMEKAMELLMQGHSVSETAYDVGYSSIPNFSASFKDYFHQSASSVITR